MGTRADFYIKDQADFYWIGSIGWDGYPEGIDQPVLKATELDSFKSLVGKFLSREDATFKTDGWPWPWEDSNTTDYAYVFDVQQKQVFISNFGSPFFTLKENNKYDRLMKKYSESDDEDAEMPDFDEFLLKIKRTEKFTFPNMKDIQNVKLDGPGSGIIVVRRVS